MSCRRSSIRVVAGAALLAALAVGPASAVASPAWTPSITLGFTPFTVAMSADGTTVYGGIATIAGQSRSVVQVRPPGGPLGPVQALSTAGAANPRPPVIAPVAGGGFAAAWREGVSVETAVMPAGGQSFGAVLAMPEPAAGVHAGQDVALAVDAAGNDYVIWDATLLVSTTETDYLLAGVRTASGTGLAPQTLASSTSSASSATSFSGLNVSVSDAGDAIAGWLATSGPGGSQMTTAQVAVRRAPQPFAAAVTVAMGSQSSASRAEAPSVAMNAGGQAAIGDANHLSNSDVKVEYRSVTGVSVASGQTVAASGGIIGAVTTATPSLGTLQPEVAIGPDGRVAFAFMGTAAATTAVQVAFAQPGHPIGATVQTISSPAAPPSSFALASSPTGELVLGYPGLSTGAYAAVAPAGGASFGTAATFGAPTTVGAGPTVSAVAANASGDGVAAGIGGATAAGYDVSGPALNGLSVPASATAGSPAALSVAPVDVWSPVASVSWAFGDGATASGASVAHAYAAAGSQTVTVTATDAVGNSSTSSAPVSVLAPAPLFSLPPGGGSAADTTPPAISAVSLSTTSFAVAKSATALSATAKKHKAKLGTTIRFTLSEAAAIKLAIARETAGLRKGKTCVKPTTTLRKHHAKRCVLLVSSGTLRRTGVAGRNSVAFSGRLGSKPLARGRYELTITATDAAGNHASRTAPKFAIVKP